MAPQPSAPNQLCKSCRSLNFSLHYCSSCHEKKPKCETREPQWPMIGNIFHSHSVQLQSNLVSLELSAADGCHLCCLVAAGLKSASRGPHRGIDEFSSPVILSYHSFGPEEFAPSDQTPRDYIQALCGSRASGFPVTSVSWREPHSLFQRHRPLHVSPESLVSQIKDWIRLCETYQSQDGEVQSTTFHPARIVDVGLSAYKCSTSTFRRE